MKRHIVWVLLLLLNGVVQAHPMPGSVVHLSILEHVIRGNAKIPLIELANAVGAEKMTELQSSFFNSYFATHIQAVTGEDHWITQIESIDTVHDQDPVVGIYQEVNVKFILTPKKVEALRNFTFNYDAVLHQVVTHSALIYVEEDWYNGIHEEKDPQQVGVIQMDIPSGKIVPLVINLDKGSRWKGFISMIKLGMQHIREGTDHLLFLIALLLPAMLFTNGKQWGNYGGIKYSALRLLKIVTAFTIGHSLTLLLGALGLVTLPPRPVEILIAVSILVSSLHAIRPIFPGKETIVAAGFGLIHGLAFAAVLSDLQLSAGNLALSILGFNAGIELMQLFIIGMLVPWLILLSKTPAYNWIRVIFATLAAIAAISWILQRTTGRVNPVTAIMDELTVYHFWMVVVLAILSLAVYAATVFMKKKAG